MEEVPKRLIKSIQYFPSYVKKNILTFETLGDQMSESESEDNQPEKRYELKRFDQKVHEVSPVSVIYRWFGFWTSAGLVSGHPLFRFWTSPFFGVNGCKGSLAVWGLYHFLCLPTLKYISPRGGKFKQALVKALRVLLSRAQLSDG